MPIVQATSAAHLEAARLLFREYAEFLGPIECFTTLQQEVASLPGEYAPPRGALLLAAEPGGWAGCVGLRALPACPGAGEVKRLFVRPEYRGRGLGRRLMEALLAEARRTGYARLWLDTVESAMPQAAALYRSMGFRPIAPYTGHDIPSTCMGLELAPGAGSPGGGGGALAES